MFVYYYADSNQLYIASVVLKYCNPEASDGFTPTGAALDVSEIYSAAVITDAIQELGLSTSVESIRSNITVEAIIPSEEKTKKDALLAKGEEYVYHPVSYTVTYTADSTKSMNYARDVLDAVLNSYYAYYGAKYVDYVVFPNNAGNVTLDQYDYINCAEILDASCNAILSSLEMRANLYPHFRSAATGYSFTDLWNAYRHIRNHQITEIFAGVFHQTPVLDKQLLISRYQNEIEQCRISLENNAKTADELWSLISQFGEKTLAESGSAISGSEDEKETYIINNVFDDDNHVISDTTTTYDKLIYRYTAVCTEKSSTQRKIDQYQFYLDLFADAQELTADHSETLDLDNLIQITTDKMNDLYEIVKLTIEECNEYNCAKNVIPLTSITAYEKIDQSLYTVLSLVVFLIIGCGAAVVLGRTGDFIQYFLYIDKKTGLPNRSSIDLLIDQKEKTVLPGDFSCIAMRIRFAASKDRFLRRKDGDEMLNAFGKILNSVFEDKGFVGYNEGRTFLAFLEETSYEDACLIADRIIEETEYYNRDEDFCKIEVDYGIANAHKDQLFNIRDLLLRAMKAMKEKDGADASELHREMTSQR